MKPNYKSITGVMYVFQPAKTTTDRHVLTVLRIVVDAVREQRLITIA